MSLQRVNKLDHYALVLDEIFVEVDLLALLCDQFNIGKVTPSCRADTNSSAGPRTVVAVPVAVAAVTAASAIDLACEVLYKD